MQMETGGEKDAGRRTQEDAGGWRMEDGLQGELIGRGRMKMSSTSNGAREEPNSAGQWPPTTMIIVFLARDDGF